MISHTCITELNNDVIIGYYKQGLVFSMTHKTILRLILLFLSLMSAAIPIRNLPQ